MSRFARARRARAVASLESARDVDGAPSAARRDAFRRDVADASRGLSEWWCRGRGSGVTYEACRDALMASRKFARGSTGDGRAATPQDACLLRVACRAKAYDDIDAFGLLDDARSVEIDARGTCLEATDFLLSRYYGGRAHLARKRCDDAAKWFRDAVTAPANALSAIAVVCLKKYVLARALSEKTSLAALSRAESELPPLSSAAVSEVPPASRDFDAYAEMQTAIASRSVDEYERVAEAHAETYAADGNAGLVDLLRERVLAERSGLARRTRRFVWRTRRGFCAFRAREMPRFCCVAPPWVDTSTPSSTVSTVSCGFWKTTPSTLRRDADVADVAPTTRGGARVGRARSRGKRASCKESEIRDARGERDAENGGGADSHGIAELTCML